MEYPQRAARHAWLPLFIGALVSGCSGADGTARSLPSASFVTDQDFSRDATRPAFYVSDLGTSASIYPIEANQSAPQPLVTLTQEITRSGSIGIDAKGTAYVVNECCAASVPYVSVVAFERGQTTPSLRIADGLTSPGGVAVRSDGTVFVSDVRTQNEGDVITGTVVLYKPGATSPEATISLPDPTYGLEAGGIVFDAQGNALVATLNPETNDVHIFRIPHDSRKPTDTGIQGAAGTSIALDAAGNLYTANLAATNGTVAVYAPGATRPTRIYNLGPQIMSIAAASDGTLYAATGNKGILEVAPGGNSVEKTFQIAGSGVALGQY